MFRRHLLFLALLAALPVQAQLDRYGRDIGAGRALLPLDAPPPLAETPPPRGAAFTLLPFQTQATGSWPEAVRIGDITGDGRADVVMTTGFYFSKERDYHVFVFPQSANGALTSPSRLSYQQTANRNGLALGNFDGQGALDVAVGAGSGVSLLYASGSEPWLTFGSVLVNQQAEALATLDLDNAGRDDFVSISWSSGGMRFVANDQGGYTATPWAVTVAGYNSLASGDLDGDGDADLAAASGQGGLPNVRLSRNNGDGTLTEIGSLSASCGGWNARGIGIGDLNGDGINDIVVSAGGNQPGACLQLFRGTGGGSFDAPQTLTSYDIPETLVVADIDLDGRADVIVLHGGWLSLGVYRQLANGTLATEQLFSIPYASHYGTQGLAVGDFSGDGCPDVAIADYNAGLVTLENGMDCGRLFADGFQ